MRTALLGAAIGSWSWAVYAQEAQPVAQPGEAQPQHAKAEAGLETVIVTATALPTRKIDASIAISTLSANQLEQISPQSSADILRDIPGIRAEASGGEGNANIAVRGLPVASGGAKFVQFQEDGLPILLFGDIAFGTADTWIKADYNIENIEVVRGGAASTFASDAPGAVINFIDKTGTEEGGAIGLTSGLNFDQERFDADYGGPLADGWRFHVGGFYREGEGARSVDYLAENGGELKANITHDLPDGGFLRLNVEFLDDRTPAYLPVPVRETGSGVSSLAGFDALTGTLNSNDLLSTLSLDHNGNKVTTDLSDGYHVQTEAVGGELSLKVGDGWRLDDKFRVAINSGDFVSPYPADVDTVQNLAASIGGAGSTVRYATGPNAGQVIANPGGLNGNGLAVNTVLFNVTIPDFNNYSNLLTLSKTFDVGDYGDVTLLAGYFMDVQNLVMDWHWTDYLLDVNGSNPRLLDVYNANGQKVTQGGLVAYYAQGFGCVSCTRYYDLQYVANAPYANLTWHTGPLTVDGSLRYDILNASGTYQQASSTFLADLTGNGVPEQTASATSGAAQGVDYTRGALSYSFGANYLLDPDLALFGRVSRGARFNADRALPPLADGSVPEYQAIARVEQQEAGVKWQQNRFNLFVTGFHATTDEYGTDINNTGLFIYDRSYEAYGVETEAAAHFGPITVNGGVTWTHARITADPFTPADIGQAPQRQAEWVYQLTPTYNAPDFTIGANIIGTSGAPAGQPSTVTMPGYVVVGLFGQYFLTDHAQISLDVKNLFDEFAVTEIDQGGASLPANGLATARTIPGRTIELGLKYTF